MKKLAFLMVILIVSNTITAQKVKYFESSRGYKHLCGIFPLKILEKDTVFQKWFNENYLKFSLSDKKHNWAKKLKDVEVTIYLGTWCGDTKKQVPQFVKLWDELRLNRSQLNFIALYAGVKGKYKQAPNGEEKGKGIHRVPTFIFRRKGKEIARIVESPVNDFETDVAQIALGYPSTPNYRGANYLMHLFRTKSIKKKEDKDFLRFIQRMIKNVKELNTLGNVYLDSNRIKEALTVFYYNTQFYKHEPIVYTSYAKALEKEGQIEKAIENYKKALLLDRSNKNAKQKIKELKK